MNQISGKNLYFLGKGGTGKTTIAALTGIALADKGYSIAIFSMDPAHNLFDVLEVDSSKSSLKLENNLFIEEISIDSWIKSYLQSIEKKISRSYQYLTALSLEKHIQTIRYAPGLEEYALQYAFESIIHKYDHFAFRIFDMPPTALALRFFNLTNITRIWLEQLIQLRTEILEKKKIIDEVHQKQIERSSDKILKELTKLRTNNQKMIDIFKDKSLSEIYIIQNEDELSINEARKIFTSLNSNDYNLGALLINKNQNLDLSRQISQIDKNIQFFKFPLAQDALIGKIKLRDYISQNNLNEYINSILYN